MSVGGEAKPDTGALRAWCAEGRAAWPELGLDDDFFLEHLAQHRAALQPAHLGELYLAAGCTLGLPRALEAFERLLAEVVPRAVASFDASAAFAEEVMQALREGLLCARPGAEPRIGEYSGAGALGGWLRVAAVRAALTLRRGRQHEATDDVDDVTLQRLPVAEDPESAYLRASYQREFEQALKASFAQLTPEQRNVLRLRFSANLTSDAIAAMLGASRATVTRWLASARGALLQHTVERLRTTLRLTTREAESLIRGARSQLHLSMGSMFQEPG